MLFLLDARVRNVVDPGFETEVGGGALNEAKTACLRSIIEYGAARCSAK